MPDQHIWDDDEEPLPCKNDRHVTDKTKYEQKLPFDVNQYGADLNEVMATSQRSSSNDSVVGSSRLKKKNSKMGLMRKMTLKQNSFHSTDAFGMEAIKKRGKKIKKMTTTTTTDGFDNFDTVDPYASLPTSNKGPASRKFSRGGESMKNQIREIAPQALDIKKEVDRPHEKDVIPDLEQSIEKKRARVTMEAKHRAEKEQQ